MMIRFDVTHYTTAVDIVQGYSLPQYYILHWLWYTGNS